MSELNEDQPVKGYTLPQLALKLSVHRTTLKRLEDRGIIDRASWITKPVRGRFYTEAQAKKVEEDLEAYFGQQRDGVTFAPVVEEERK